MIPVWWAWVGVTMFANRFDCDDIGQRIMSFAQMFGIIILAAHINTDFDAYYQGFLLSYAAIRFLTVGMYIRTGLHKPEARDVSNLLALAFSIGALISLSSLFFDGLTRYIVMYAGIGFAVVDGVINDEVLRLIRC